MQWYLVHTKPRQEQCAFENLQRQGYECFLPTLLAEKVRQGKLVVVQEPLFPRYLFIRLGQDDSAQSWAPIRFTRGVSRLVSFGVQPAKVDERLVQQLQAKEASLHGDPQRLFTAGQRVRLTEAPFTDIEGIYLMAEGERRAMVLIELMSKRVVVPVDVVALRSTAAY